MLNSVNIAYLCGKPSLPSISVLIWRLCIAKIYGMSYYKKSTLLCNGSSLVFVHINLYNLCTLNCDGSIHIFISMWQDTKASALVRWASLSSISTDVYWYVWHVFRMLWHCIFCCTGHKRGINNIQDKFSAFSIILYFESHIYDSG